MFKRLLQDAAPAEQAARSIDYAAQSLGVGRSTVYGLIRSGQLKTFKIGRRRLTTDEFIAKVVEDAAA